MFVYLGFINTQMWCFDVTVCSTILTSFISWSHEYSYNMFGILKFFLTLGFYPGPLEPWGGALCAEARLIIDCFYKYIVY